MAATTTPTSSSSSRFTPVTAVAGLSALGVLYGGILHFQIWKSDYKDIPDGAVPGLWVVKKGFPINAAVSVVLAIALLLFAVGVIVRLGKLAVLGAAAVELGSIIALVLSRKASIFGWKETGWDGDAKKVLVTEIVSVVLLVATLFLDYHRNAPAE